MCLPVSETSHFFCLFLLQEYFSAFLMSTKVRGVSTSGIFSASSAASLDSLSATSLPLFLHDQESNSILSLYSEFSECQWFV